ncbi:MAG: DUF2062 domain-containing protein [Rubrivivax sp.]|nr:DUF2062 domain-containing protein [Rubrivivax sp.]
MRERFRRYLPSAERLQASPSLRWLRPLLDRPWLWHLTRHRVAAGAAIGVFFGFLIPVLQIAAAAAAALLLRANLPVAAVATLVSNPFTYVPIGVAAYQTGSALLGERVDAEQARARAETWSEQMAAEPGDESWSARVLAIGKPLMLGLLVFASVGAVFAWAAVHALWIAGVAVRRRRRRAQRGPPPA